MRVTLATQFFPPEHNAPANRLATFASVLHARTSLEVVTLEPSYPEPSLYDPVATAAWDRDAPFPVHRLPRTAAHGGVVTRGFRELGLSGRIVDAAMSLGPDLLWVSSPSMFLVTRAAAAVRGSSTRLVVDVRDLTWEYARDSSLTGAPHHRFFAAAVGRWIRRALRVAAVVLVTNEGARRWLEADGIDSERIVVAPNGVDHQRLTSLSDVPAPKDDDGFVVTYVGLVGHNQELDVLLDAARRLPAVDFRIVGGGPRLDRLDHRVKSEELANVELLGQRPAKEVPELYAATDVLFASLKGSRSLLQTAVPSKIFEYMAVGRPIVYVGGGVAGAVIRESGAGVVIPPEDLEELVTAIEGLRADSERRECMRLAGRSTARDSIREDLVSGGVQRALTILEGSETTADC